MAVSISPFFALTAAELSIKDILFTASVNGPAHFSKKPHLLKSAYIFTSLMMALHALPTQIIHQTSLNGQIPMKI